jgi:malonate-semialdehyde dehydrogenase (acetylating) / methylmalonate-semialdehyde dehydrogenase
MVGVLAHFIGGQRVNGASGRFADVIDPATGRAQTLVPLASKAEVHSAIVNADKVQPAWSAISSRARARVLFRFLALAEQEVRWLAKMLSREHGKNIDDATVEVRRGIEIVESATGIPHLLAATDAGDVPPDIDIGQSRAPLGVVAGITSFSLPAVGLLSMAATALVCGNTIVLKPCERNPSVPLWLAEMFVEAGLPPGVLNVVNGDKHTAQAILRDPRIKAIGFAGSAPAANAILDIAAANGKCAQFFDTTHRSADRPWVRAAPDRAVADWVRFYTKAQSVARAPVVAGPRCRTTSCHGSLS